LLIAGITVIFMGFATKEMIGLVFAFLEPILF